MRFKMIHKNDNVSALDRSIKFHYHVHWKMEECQKIVNLEV